MEKNVEMQQQQEEQGQPPPYPPAYSAHDNSGFTFSAETSYQPPQQQSLIINPAFNAGPTYGFNGPQPTPPHFSSPPMTITTATAAGLPIDRLMQIMNQAEEFAFVQTDTISIFGQTTIMIPVHDGQGRPLMSIVRTSGTIIRRDDHMDIHTGSLTIFNDPTGNLLVTAKEEIRSITVKSGDVTLGTIDGWGPWRFNVSARNSMGQPAFSIIERGSDHIFLGADGIEIATLRNSQGSTTTLRFKPGIEPRLKSLVVTAGFMLFLFYFVQTSFGPGMRRALWCFMGSIASVFLIVIIAVIIVFVVVF